MNVSWDVAISAQAELGERPFWDAATGSLMWVDILAGHLHRYRPGVGDSVFHTAGVAVGAAAPRAGGVRAGRGGRVPAGRGGRAA